LEEQMKYLRKLTAAVLIVCMSVGLTACGKTAAKSLNIEQSVTITVWYQDEKYTDYIDYVAREFNKENSLVTINSRLVTDDNYVEYLYEQSVHGDNAPDVFLMSTDNLEKATMTGLVAENSSYDKYYTNKYYSNTALNAATYNGRLYGYPLSFNVAYLLYNADVASAVSNFSELADFCNNYQITVSNENVTQLVLWNASDMFINYGFSCGSIDIGGESGDDSDELSVDKNRLKSAMEKFVEQKDVFGISRSAYTVQEIMELFAQGKVAYTITDATNLKTVADSGVNYGICELPDFDDNLKTTSMSENVCAFVNPYGGQMTVAKAVAHALSFDYSDSLYDLSGVLSARQTKSKAKNYSTRIGKLYEIYDNSTVKAKFMGSAYFYTKYDIMIHQIWDGSDMSTSIDSFVGEIRAK
jgi:maltose-binding protein MalE